MAIHIYVSFKVHQAGCWNVFNSTLLKNETHPILSPLLIVLDAQSATANCICVILGTSECDDLPWATYELD